MDADENQKVAITYLDIWIDSHVTPMLAAAMEKEAEQQILL